MLKPRQHRAGYLGLQLVLCVVEGQFWQPYLGLVLRVDDVQVPVCLEVEVAQPVVSPSQPQLELQ